MAAIESPSDPRWGGALEQLLKAARGGTVVWDFDGVVADSEPVHAESYRVLLEQRGVVPPKGFFARMVGHPETEIWSMLAEGGLGVSDPVDVLVSERRKVVLDLARRTLRPTWVATELLPLLAPVARNQTVVSAGDPDTISELLALWGLGRWLSFQPAVGRKLERLEQLWSQGSSVTIEDNANYLKWAQSAGSYCVAVEHSLSGNLAARADLLLGI